MGLISCLTWATGDTVASAAVIGIVLAHFQYEPDAPPVLVHDGVPQCAGHLLVTVPDRDRSADVSGESARGDPVVVARVHGKGVVQGFPPVFESGGN
jgi:hypothetical protein